jgi:inner membrane protein
VLRFLPRPPARTHAQSASVPGCDIILKMPSPLGHALGGIAAGCAVLPARTRPQVLLFAIAGMTADLDLILPMTHRGAAHSIAAAILAFIVAMAAVGWKRSAPRARFAAAVGVAYLTHVLFDWLGEDSGPPSGIMALWPFSHEYYVSGLDVFAGVDRRYWLPGFWRQNLTSIVREIIILAPITLIILVLTRSAARRPRTHVE